MDIRILIVDDSKIDVMMIKNILYDYELLVANDGVEAMDIITSGQPIDIMILDLNMPRMNGFEVLKAMRNYPDCQKIATLILTNSDELENEIRGLELGALDYIRKPLNLESLRKRIQIHVTLRNARRELEENNSILEQTVTMRTNELVITRDITIHALIGLLEARDIESSNHTRRTQLIIRALCACLQKNARFSRLLTDSYMYEIYDTAPLHDIGKVGIPDNILLKPGKLAPEEFEIMKKHVEFGVHALEYKYHDQIKLHFVDTALEVISGHHERYDGTGYPKGLTGDEIPLPGRLMAIVDVYDALISKRVYKEAIPHEEAISYITAQRSKHFDPDLVDAFLEVEDQIIKIVAQYTPRNEGER